MFNTETQDPKNPLLEEKSVVEKQKQLNSQEVETVRLIVQAVKENNQEEFFRLLNLVKNTQIIDAEYMQDRRNALHSTAFYGRTHFIAPLIRMGADINKPNNYGKTPIYMAISQGRAAAVTALIAAGAVVDKPNTLIHIAAMVGNVEILGILIALGANVNTLNGQGETPLHWACKCPNNASLITALCKAGAIVDALNHTGETPVWIAAYLGHAQALNALWAAGANIHTPNKDGITPLFIATEKRHLTAMQVLLAAGADASEIKRGAGLCEMKKSRRCREFYKIMNCLEEHFNQYPTGIKPAGLIANRYNLRSSVKRVSPSNVDVNNHKKPLVSTSISEKAVISPNVQPEQKNPSESRMLSQFQTFVKPSAINISDLSVFLKFVAEGEQDKAEAMLINNIALVLMSGSVTDLSKRTFINITGFQYAVWALDWQMWTMLLKYIPSEVVTEQIAQLEQGLWVPQHGITANWENLIQSLNQYVSEVCSQKPIDVYEQTWIKQVGGAQLLLPAHVINEYCHPTRPFHPVPDFTKLESTGAWRTRVIHGGEWFSTKVSGGTLGEKFAVCRVSYERSLPAWSLCFGIAERDGTAIAALLKTRTSQRAALFAQYFPKSETAPKVAHLSLRDT